jgi:penicillin-binding protein 2
VSEVDPTRRQRLRFSRRNLLLGAGQATLFGVLGWRLRQLQILDSSEYRLLADENRLSVQLVAPIRGTLYDRFGARIAGNRENLRVLVIPAFSKNLAATLTTLSSVVTVHDADRDRVLRLAKRQSGYLPILVAEGLTWRQFALLNVLAPQLPGVETDVAQIRTYFHARSMAHAVGYVGMAGKGEVEGDPVTRLPGFRIGKAGLEKGLDRELRGRPGSINYEVDSHGRIVRELGSTPSEPGKDVVLSLDLEMQEMALNLLADHRRGSVVALDAVTGAVLIMASTPSYDPNEIVFNVDPKRWQALIKDKEDPLNNRAGRGLYPPGSTFKVVTALAGLTSGVIDPKERIVCRGGYPFGNHYFHCWRSGGHGPIALHDAIKASCDVYFYETAHRLGIDRLAVTGRALGLGQTYDCELSGLKSGVMPDQAWKRRTLGAPWYAGETISCGIGQGYVLATPLQLAVATARIATGRAIVPRLRGSAPGQAAQIPPLQNVDAAHLTLVRDGMAAVVNEGGGTANRAALGIPGVFMAGKTGTAQSFSHDARHPPTGWEAEPHSLFIAFAPVDSPRYAVACVVEHGGYGSRAAAPIVHDVMTELIMRDPARQPVFIAPERRPSATLAEAESAR